MTLDDRILRSLAVAVLVAGFISLLLAVGLLFFPSLFRDFNPASAIIATLTILSYPVLTAWMSLSFHKRDVNLETPLTNRLKTLTAANFLVFLAAFSLTIIQIEPYSSLGDILYFAGMVLFTGIAAFILTTDSTCNLL